MEEKSIKFCNFFTNVALNNFRSIKVSKTMKYFFIHYFDNSVSVYRVTKDTGTSHGPIWTIKNILSCVFSEDENELLVVSDTKCFQLFEIEENSVTLVQDTNFEEIVSHLQKYDIDFQEHSEVNILRHSQKSIILFIDNTSLVNLKLYPEDAIFLRSRIEIQSCVTLAVGYNIIYTLTAGGNVSAYNLEDGQQIGVIHLYARIPHPKARDVLSFTHLAVSPDGEVLAVADRANQVFVLRLKNEFVHFDDQEQLSVNWDCGTSMFSYGSDTSTKTNAIQPRILSDNVSISPSIVPDLQPDDKNKINWNNYLQSLHKKYRAPVVDCQVEVQNLQQVPGPPTGLVVRGLYVTSGELSVWYTEPDNTLGGIYHLHNINSELFDEEYVPVDTVVLPGGFLGLRDAFISSKCLWLFLGNLSHEILVGKLLQYMPMESVGHLLQGEAWTNLMVPLPTLSSALQEQQLDVAHLAVELHVHNLKSGFSNYGDEITLIEKLVIDLDRVLTVISEAMKWFVNKPALCEQLIISTLEKMNDLLAFLESSDNPYSCNVIERIMEHVIKLRKHLLCHLPNIKQIDLLQRFVHKECMESSFDDIWQKWKGISDMEVICDSVLSNCIPLAQEFLLLNRDWNKDSFQSLFQSHIDEWIKSFLDSSKFEKAEEILFQVGDDSKEKLLEICTKTCDYKLRDELASYLLEKGFFPSKQKEAWTFVKEVETIVGVVDITYAKETSQTIYGVLFDIEAENKLSIFTVMEKTDDWKEDVLISLFFNVPGAGKLKNRLKPERIWKYFLDFSCDEFLCMWISCCFSSDVIKVADELSQWEEKLHAVPVSLKRSDIEILTAKDLILLFSSWDISQDMIDSVSSSKTMPIVVEKVLNHLSSFGVFSTNEKCNVSIILRRLIMSGNVDNLEYILNQTSGNVTFSEFQMLLTKLLIDNNLCEIAFPCLEEFEYSSTQLQELQVYSKQANKDDWLSLWQVFREWTKNVTDEKTIYSCILNSAHFLSNGNLEQYLQNHPFVVLALLMYSGKPFSEWFSSKSHPDLDSKIIDTTLKHYPLLARAVNKLNNCHEEKQDITVYQLLEGNAPFDVSKLFGWQETHKICGEEFPHFMSDKLVKQYGIKRQMTYLTYLKLVRPTFAFCRFIIDQYKTYGTLSYERIDNAGKAAHGLALQYYEDIDISTACLAFNEMIGKNNNLLKLDLCCARKVLNYMQNNTISRMDCDHAKTIGNLLHRLAVHNSSSAASSLLNLLEKALLWEFHQTKEMSYHMKAVKSLQEWGLAVKFAKAHGLKLPEKFLKHLTSNNNWLLFLLYIQLYKYPMDQVKILTESFSSEALQEHMFYALQVEICDKDTGSSELKQGIMKKLYQRVFHSEDTSKDKASTSKEKARKPNKRRKSRKHSSEATLPENGQGLPTSFSSGSSGEEFLANNLISYDVWKGDETKDLFLLVLKCHSEPDPLKAFLQASVRLHNPIYAVLATCYDNGQVELCFCTWLLASLPYDKQETFAHELNSPADQIWQRDRIHRLFQEIISLRFLRTLRDAFWIFFPENPLHDYVNFLYEAVVKFQFEESLIKLKLFKASYLNMKNSEIVLPEGGSCFNDASWVGHVAVQLITTTLIKGFSSLHMELKFLAVIQEGDFFEHLPNSATNIKVLENIFLALELTGVFPDLEVLCQPVSSTVFLQEIERCLQELLKCKLYNAALKLAAATGLTKDFVLLAQWQDKYEQLCLDKKSIGSDAIGFWKKCNEAFHNENVESYNSAKFFLEHAHKVEQTNERYCILQFAVHWLKKACNEHEHIGTSQQLELTQAELLMWNCWLQADSDLPLFLENSSVELLYVTKAKVIELSGARCLPISMDIESAEDKDKLNLLIGKVLNVGDLITACRLEAMYNYKHQDVQILLLCLALAEGKISPYELTSDQRVLLSGVPIARNIIHRRRALVSSISSMSHSPGSNSLLGDYVEIPPREHQDTLVTLEKLTSSLKYGMHIGNRVVMCYRVAMNLDMTYEEVLELRDPLILLKTALADDCMNKFIVASDLITAAQISSLEVAEFLCREIYTAVKRSKLKEEVCGTIMWGVDLDSSFHLVLDICDDQSVLGSKLLDLVSETTSSVQNFREAYLIAVELIIHAHNCFVAALNMEGIGLVLQMCKNVSHRLARKHEWALMVRLLIGIGRYTEMTYIFQILYEKEQFEYLLGRGLSKIKSLKLAVLDFLRIHCPNDRKLREIVTLRFSMFGEVAALWQSDAEAQVTSLLEMVIKNADGSVHLPNVGKVNKHLLSAMDCYKHASEFYLKAEKLSLALNMAHQAELVALQVHFVNTGSKEKGTLVLLNLRPDQIVNIINHHLSFLEACILIRAYNHPVDWGLALFHQCVVNKKETYFSEFLANVTLTSGIIEDVARRFQVCKDMTAENAQMMKKFVQLVKPLDVKYRLASQLGFRDITECLINGSDADTAYLKDTVWKHGFRRY